MALSRDQLVRRAAQELREGNYVNLGIGIPTLIANVIPPGMEVILQSERIVPGGGVFWRFRSIKIREPGDRSGLPAESPPTS